MARKKSKRKLIITLIITALVILAVISFFFLRRNNIYMTATAENGDIETYFSFSGNVESKNTENVMSEKLMQISKIKVSEDEKIKKDTVLFVTSQGEEIKSKTEGTVSEIYAEEGMTVMSGMKLCDIIDFDNLRITVKIDEYDLSSISKDKDVTVIIGALDKEIAGKVSSVSKTAVNQNGVAYFTGIIELAKDEAIKIGMTAEIRILNKSAKNVLLIPVKALSFDDNDKPYVIVKNDRGRYVTASVEIGINDGKNAEVLKGLNKGQEVFYKKTKSDTENYRRLEHSSR